MAPAHLAENTTDPARYRRTGAIPRQRVEFVESGGLAEPGGPDIYQADWPDRRRRKGRRRARRRAGRTVTLLTAVSVAGAAVGGIVAFGGPGLPGSSPVPVGAALDQRDGAPPAAGRGGVRVAPSASASGSPSAKSAKASRSPSPRPPKPVSGLNQTQMNNAAVIVRVAQQRDLPRRAMLVAVMTGLQESSLRNLANDTIPASLDRPNEGSGDDFDSLGLFQQRPSQGWGSVKELMTPSYAAGAFYSRLVKVDDWEELELGEAAQTVQRSALPDAYDKHEKRATEVVDALT
ncbi:hypothetical protein [Actinoplanes sp. G11-F43]|uniref:hypothetical protein n=1 Tax=Actinoplanes sp. G11-F43 TaxID=3424130 RepID=UPI003D32E06A